MLPEMAVDIKADHGSQPEKHEKKSKACDRWAHKQAKWQSDNPADKCRPCLDEVRRGTGRIVLPKVEAGRENSEKDKDRE